MRYAPFAAMLIAMAAPVSAEDEKSTAQAQADLQKTRAEVLDAQLKTIRDGAEAGRSASSADTIEAAAEARIVGSVLYSALGANIANAVKPELNGNPNPPLILYDDKPPSVARWLAFKQMTTMLDMRLRNAKKAWDVADKGGRCKASAEAGGDGEAEGAGGIKLFSVPLGFAGATAAASAFLPAVGAAVTVMSMFRTDYAVKGQQLSIANAVLDTTIRQHLGGDVSAFAIAGALDTSDGSPAGLLQALDAPYRTAEAAYRDGYLAMVAALKKDEKPGGACEAAGRLLAGAVSDYEALVVAAYTPVDGVLPLTMMERERALLDRKPPQPVLYIRDHGASLTSITRKGFLHSFGGPPITLAAAATVDYMLVVGADAKLVATATCAVPLQMLDRVIRRPMAGQTPVLPGAMCFP